MALLAQAAFNLANLGYQRDRMLQLGTEYYTSAMEKLRLSPMEQQKDYGTFVTCIMTLMFGGRLLSQGTEVYKQGSLAASSEVQVLSSTTA